MNAIKTTVLLLVIFILGLGLTACDSNTVQQYVVATMQYTSEADLKNAVQPDSLTAGEEIYASVYFIESPLGMEYTARWSLDDKEISSQKKAMTTDKQGILVYTLSADQVKTGKLQFEILYGNDILCTKELTVQ